jgi:hypothetical protein
MEIEGKDITESLEGHEIEVSTSVGVTAKDPGDAAFRLLDFVLGAGCFFTVKDVETGEKYDVELGPEEIQEYVKEWFAARGFLD